MINQRNFEILDEDILDKPFVVPYNKIYTICDENNQFVELIEESECISGACWSYHHYSQSPLVLKSRIIGNTVRYILKVGDDKLNLISSTKAAGISSVRIYNNNNEVSITYMGLGGGGIGATVCRSSAKSVLRYKISDFGGEKEAIGMIYLDKLFRVLIAIDDTDSCDKGATWTLTYNIAKKVSNSESKFISQSLVQLYPVPEKTQNCMSTVLEFGCKNKDSKNKLINNIKKLLLKYSESKNTGMLVYSGFSIPKILTDYSIKCRTEKIDRKYAMNTILKSNVEIILDGNGIIGALAAFSWFSNPFESTNPKFLKNK